MSQLDALMAAEAAAEGNAASIPVNDSPETTTEEAPDAAAVAKATAAEQATNGKKPEPPKDETPAQKVEREKAEAAAAAKKPETKEEKASAARFAALARQKSDVEDARTELRRGETQLETERATFQRDLTAARTELDTARATLAEERKTHAAEREAFAEKLLKDPDYFFDFIKDELGIKDMGALRKHAEAAWTRPPKQAAAPAKIDDKDKPLTRAELEKLQAEHAQKQAADRQVAEERAAFIKATEHEDFEAAQIVFSEDERYAQAALIAKGLQAAKERFTVEDLADAVNELAKRTPRWQRVLKRSPQATTAAGKPGTGSDAARAATQATVTQGRQATQATRALANDSATERAAPPNGSAGGTKTPTTREERKAARAARISKAMADAS